MRHYGKTVVPRAIWLALVICLPAPAPARGDSDSDIAELVDDLDNHRADTAGHARIVRDFAAKADPSLAPKLIELLAHHDAAVRQGGADILKAITPPPADAFVAALKHDRVRVRIYAAKAVGLIGEKRAVDPLVALLTDSSESVRKEAAGSLARLGPAATATLTKLLAETDNPLHETVVEILGQGGDRAAVDPLIGALAAKSPHVRLGAARALGKLRARKAATALLKMLNDPDIKVQAQAARASGLAGGDDVLAALVPLLKHRKWEIKAAAAEGLGHLGDKQAVGPLLVALKDARRDVRSAAATSLGAVGDAKVVKPLAAALDSGTYEAAASLAKIGKPSVEALAALLDHPDEDVEDHAALALAQLGDKRALVGVSNVITMAEWDGPSMEAIEALVGLKDRRAIPLMLKLAAGRARSDEARIFVIRSLGEFGGPEVAEGLTKVMKKSGYRITREIVKVLRGTGSGAAESLIGVLTSTSSTRDERREAVRDLGRLGDKRAVAPLAKVMTEPGMDLCAGDALVNIGAPAVPALVGLLGHEKIGYRARNALIEIGDASVPATIEALKNPGPEVRRRATDVLGELKAKKALEPLLAMMADKSDRARSSAVEALGAIGDRRAVGPLVAVLKDTDESIRVRAAEALGAIGDKQAAPELVKLLRDENVWVREEAAKALGKLGGAASYPAIAAELAVAARDWDEVARLGAAAVKPLLDSLCLGVPPRGADRAFQAMGASAAEPLVRAIVAGKNKMLDRRVYFLDKSADAALAALLRDPDLAARKVAARYLTRSRWTPPTAAQKIDYLAALENWAELAELGAPAYPRLVEATGAKAPKTRSGAASALGALGDARGVKVLVTLLRDPSHTVRLVAGRALGKLSYKPATPAEKAWYLAALGRWDEVLALGPAAREPAVAGLTADDQSVRRSAAETLGKLKSKVDVPRLIQLLQRPKEPEYVCEAVVEALGAIGDPRAVKPLVAALGQPARPRLHYGAIRALRALGKPAVAGLVAALKDKDAHVRMGAAGALVAMNDSRAVPVLVTMLTHPEHARQAGRNLAELDWEPRSTGEWVRYNLAIGRYHELADKPAAVTQVLQADIIAGARPEIERAVVGLREVLRDGADAPLIELLATDGSKVIAEVYLQQRSEKIQAAARAWAARNGYKVTDESKLVPVAKDKTGGSK